ncbi:MAG TPA: cation:proton antiporter [Thermoanaerobaculia bacterium]
MTVLIVIGVALAAIGAGRLARAIGQPAMIGYVAAGVVAAFVAPRGAAFDAAVRVSSLLGEIGVLALMFASGAEIDARELRLRVQRNVPLMIAVIGTPFACGLLLAPRFPQLRGAQATPAAFAVFLATCLAVTAFPVLMEILRDWRLLATPIGTAAAGVAAVNDVVAWLLLAFVAFWSAAATPPLLVTAVFAAFFLGMVVRRGNVGRLRALFLPLFFAAVGMHVASVRGELAVAAIFIAVAVAAKLVPATLVSRLRGESWRTSLALGALLNARGAMELIAAKLGLELGLLSPAGFSALVSVAVATTIITGPLLRVVYSPSLGSTTAAAVSSSDAAA